MKHRLLSAALCGALLLLLPGCNQSGDKTDVMTSPLLAAAQLISIPAQENTFSNSFEIWIDNTSALVARNDQDPETFATSKDFFIYDTVKHTYSEVVLPESDGIYVELVSVLSDGRLMFESERVDETQADGNSVSYIINYAWLYDVSSKVGTKYDLSDLTKPDADVITVLPLNNNPHYYSVGKNSVFITYLEVNSHSYTLSPDGSKYAYVAFGGLYTCDVNFKNSKLILPRTPGNDPDGMEAEAPGAPKWLNNNQIAYSWYGYEWLIGSGIIESDGSVDTRPVLLENRTVEVTDDENLLLVYEMMNASVFIGVYDIRNNSMTDFSKQIDFADIQNVLISENCRFIFLEGVEADGTTPASLFLELSEDYTEIAQIQSFDSSFIAADTGITSSFCPDNSRLMLQGPYEEDEYQLFVAETAKLFE